jgi:hypothetical protein
MINVNVTADGRTFIGEQVHCHLALLFGLWAWLWDLHLARWSMMVRLGFCVHLQLHQPRFTGRVGRSGTAFCGTPAFIRKAPEHIFL